MADSPADKKLQQMQLTGEVSDIMVIFEKTGVFNFYCSMILPLIFVFVYATLYLSQTFENNPREV